MPSTTFDIEVIAAANLEVISLCDGATVYARGDGGDNAYIVRSGAIEIRCLERIIEVISPGEIFGGMALLDNQPRSCSAVALGDAEIMPIDRSLFVTLIRDDPDFAETVMQLTARRLRAVFVMLDQPPVDMPFEPARAAN